MRARFDSRLAQAILFSTFAAALLTLRSDAVFAQGFTAATSEPFVDETFAEMPEGWSIDRQVIVPTGQLAPLSRKLGGTLTYLNNTVIRDGQRRVQINVLNCRSVADAESVHRSLNRMKKGSRDVWRRGTTIHEFVCRDSSEARFAVEARYRLPIQPERSTYRVEFSAVPLDDFAPMQWNKLFNLFLQWESGERRESVESEMARMVKDSFRIGRVLELRTGDRESPSKTVWEFAPRPIQITASRSSHSARYEFEALPKRAGVPFVEVEGIVTAATFAALPVDASLARDRLTSGNEFWPVDDPPIGKLAAELTADAETDREKVAAILAWFTDEDNIRFGGPELGSRYGTLQVLEQKFGHCWDYSDVFITLCRAAEVPARQVVGWLHQGPGHVWAEVILDDAWHGFDPTSGLGCGSDYVPLAVSNDGRLSFVYASSVEVERIETGP